MFLTSYVMIRIISGKLFNESWVQLDEEIAALSAMSA